MNLFKRWKENIEKKKRMNVLNILKISGEKLLLIQKISLSIKNNLCSSSICYDIHILMLMLLERFTQKLDDERKNLVILINTTKKLKKFLND